MNELWAKAFEELTPGNKDYLADLPQTISSSSDFETVQEDFARRLKRVGKRGQFTDVLQKSVMLLNKLAIAGDIMVSSDPVIVAFPWAAIRAILISYPQSFAMQDKLLEGSAKITNLLALCAICRRMYLPVDNTNPDETINTKPVEVAHLEKAIVQAFICCLESIHWAFHRESRQTKYLTDLLRVGDLSGLFQELDDYDPQSASTFWLQGMAGTGKTTIGRTVARETSETKITATFYFKRDFHNRNSGKYLFPTLSYQLA
ncbi:atypical/alpha protein kinase [Fusarium sporotrichioides]|uniref:Atypical/alpha protein kinase n=1 Tax=Fusarium sporotrichioides TaxID=5514 RepID=A0A395RQQ5_FUSSP|nr:atypical/alpha protein kinase [Fusarium sporotrichioides]